MKSFEAAYSNLNKEQKEAVDAIEGPVMVVAGPGTGKTQILTLRIANILKSTDTSPENILALTFTESAVYSMRRRLAEMIGADAYRVNISTFHGFCNTIIQNYIEYFPRVSGFLPALEADQIDILEEILDENSFEKFRRQPAGISRRDSALQNIKSAISTLKRENVSVKEFRKQVLLKEKAFYKRADLWSDKKEGEIKAKYVTEQSLIEKNKELSKIYELYEAKLAKKGLYDYDDMIVDVVSTLARNKNLLAVLQEQYQYILVDEHQDTNSAQNKVVELIASFYDSPNLFIVGDEKQAIFRFQGADLNNFLYFKKLYPKVKIINLATNYRSSQSILDSAHSLISKSGGNLKDLRVELKSVKRGRGNKIFFYEFIESGAECQFISQAVKAKIDSGVEPSKIAVLVRKNSDIDAIAKFFAVAEVPYVVDSEENILSDSDIKKLVKILKAVEDFGDDRILAEALHIDLWKIPSTDIYEVFRIAKQKRLGIMALVSNPRLRETLEIDSKERLAVFAAKIASWHKLSKNIGLAEFFEKVINESGILSELITRNDAIEKIEKINVFFDELKSLIERNRNADLSDFVRYISLLEEKQLSVKRKIFGDMDLPRVKIMTAHRSKGREFDYVYIANAYEGHWGNIKREQGIKLLIGGAKPSEDEDERRLFYVALTRARQAIYISYAKNAGDGKSRLPTPFIADIDPLLVEKCDTSSYEESFKKSRHALLLSKDNKVAPLKDKAYLNARFLEYGLSVTALNNYLRCPWEYFYNNLVRIPTAENVYSLYGQAIHYALENFFKKYKLGEGADKEDLISFFLKSLETKPLSAKDFEFQKKKGVKALGGYFDEYSEEWSLYPYSNEFNIRGVEIAENVKINGKIDKIDILNAGNEVRVIDFKTGLPKSRNEIEGKTGDKSGNMKRQLIFYKLLLDNYEKGKYKMVEGVIDFVEPNDRGKYKRESFTVSAKEVADLKLLIEKVSKEIMDLSFWNNRCDDKDCDYCGLRVLGS